MSTKFHHPILNILFLIHLYAKNIDGPPKNTKQRSLPFLAYQTAMFCAFSSYTSPKPFHATLHFLQIQCLQRNWPSNSNTILRTRSTNMFSIQLFLFVLCFKYHQTLPNYSCISPFIICSRVRRKHRLLPMAKTPRTKSSTTFSSMFSVAVPLQGSPNSVLYQAFSPSFTCRPGIQASNKYENEVLTFFAHQISMFPTVLIKSFCTTMHAKNAGH